MKQGPTEPGTTNNILTRDDLPVWLIRVSRTFALTIRMLQDPLRTYASAAYLLCRVIDTIEDCETLSTETKCHYLREFCGRVAGSGEPGQAESVFAEPVTWEERLTLHESEILDLIRSFPADIQDIIFRYVVEMTEGMVMFLEQQNELGILHIQSHEQLDQYCYYVAGTVGLMMNDMFAAISGTDKSADTGAAVELGLGLQLTNIVKDIQKDRLRNIYYCPPGENPYWPGPASTPAGDDPNWEIFSLASAAISHLTGGLAYILGLESGLKQYKLFCVTNYLMAWKTLEACLKDPLRTASSDGTKISRFCVYYTLLESHGCVASNQYLSWRVDRLRNNCTSLILAAEPAQGHCRTAEG
jgi:farnesyl-diphosphate farnesyltransferase